MKERILRVLMLISILFAVGFPIGFFIFVRRASIADVVISAGIGVLVVFVTSSIQYILIAEWNPLYLFKKK